MSAAKDPTVYLWWLVSRASGIVALGLITSTVLLGLTMSAKLLRRPGLGRTLVRLHEHLALVALGAIAVHGLALLGDPWLHPGTRRHHDPVRDGLPAARDRTRDRSAATSRRCSG